MTIDKMLADIARLHGVVVTDGSLLTGTVRGHEKEKKSYDQNDNPYPDVIFCTHGGFPL